MKEALTAFQAYISRRNLKNTPQRQRIVEIFLKAGGHLTTEELCNLIKKIEPGIGQATVYRTMKLLCDSGLAKAVYFGDSIARYEPIYGSKHHDHLVCESCGAHIEVVDEEIERLQERLAKRHGYMLTSHRMSLYGLCNRCCKSPSKP
jgi:Fur family ferric uptake transcriptional regulator